MHLFNHVHFQQCSWINLKNSEIGANQQLSIIQKNDAVSLSDHDGIAVVRLINITNTIQEEKSLWAAQQPVLYYW